jgi:hypothetical protein
MPVLPRTFQISSDFLKEMASTSRPLSYNGKYIQRKKKKHRFKCENIHPRCNENYITENWWEKKK